MTPLYNFERDLLIIDTETLGLKDYHVICQWGSILLDRHTLEPKSNLSTLVYCTKDDLAIASQEAMGIHGLDPTDLNDPAKTIKFPQLLDQIIKIHGPSMRYHVYGANVYFDYNKISAMCHRYMVKNPLGRDAPNSCRIFDVQAFLNISSGAFGLGWRNGALRSMCDHFGLPYSKHHSAHEDCELLADVMRSSMQQIHTLQQ